jgi:hypothetical protein
VALQRERSIIVDPSAASTHARELYRSPCPHVTLHGPINATQRPSYAEPASFPPVDEEEEDDEEDVSAAA